MVSPQCLCHSRDCVQCIYCCGVVESFSIEMGLAIPPTAFIGLELVVAVEFIFRYGFSSSWFGVLSFVGIVDLAEIL